jgi:Flp pilus assembly protein TadD
MRLPLFAALLIAPLAGCAGLSPPGAEESGLAKAVEPSLRAAAVTADANNDWKGAAQHWRTLYQRLPGEQAITLSLARALRYSGQGQQAADVVQTELARHGRDARLVGELGKAYLAADRIGLAVRNLEEAQALTPDDWELHSALGVALDSLTRHDEARTAYGRALQLAPDHPLVLNNLGLSQALDGQLDEAIATLTHAHEQPQAGMQIRQNLALLLALQGDAEAAERVAAKDLPAEMVRNNAGIYRMLATGRR